MTRDDLPALYRYLDKLSEVEALPNLTPMIARATAMAIGMLVGTIRALEQETKDHDR